MAYGTLIETHTHPREYVARSSTDAKRFRNREGFSRWMRKVLGVLTEDFRLYHDLVAALKTRHIPFVTLSDARKIPENVGAVITSPVEAPQVRRAHVIADDDVDSGITEALPCPAANTGGGA